MENSALAGRSVESGLDDIRDRCCFLHADFSGWLSYRFHGFIFFSVIDT
jgi:hypothetical protein